MDVFSANHFRDDTAAREYLEKLLWPAGPVCPHCGVINHAYATKRPGVFRCAEKKCRKDFTVTMRTVMERSKIALHKWLQAFHLMCSSKKGVSAHQLHRTLDIGYEAAWFMAHRIREAMRDGGLSPLGGEGKIVEADETYFGNIPKAKRPTKTTSGRPFTGSKHGRGPSGKRAVVSLVERGGRVRSFHPAVADAANVAAIVRENIHRETRLHTDESRLYPAVGTEFAAHETINHSAKEYARGDVTTNSVEGYFSIFKRGMRGVYQHCGEKHLHRYLAEYDFRYNHRVKLGYSDGERAALAVQGAAGKRLTYRGRH
ncbi:MAG: ISSpo8, transposase [Xanthobacteraceae bacterium]|nr:ISSpo8, transposase [Xanthobacteraceae bacterium]